MSYSEDELDRIFASTDGRCQLCWSDLVRAEYGSQWEVDHSNPRARGGTDMERNLMPSCVSCNRSKQDRSNDVVRRENGHTRAPRSKQERNSRSTAGALLCALVGAAFGPAGVILGAVTGVVLGHSDDDRSLLS